MPSSDQSVPRHFYTHNTIRPAAKINIIGDVVSRWLCVNPSHEQTQSSDKHDTSITLRSLFITVFLH